jgi:hypothetical protein
LHKAILEHAAHLCHEVIPAMAAVRKAGDTLEGMVADDLWPLAKYGEVSGGALHHVGIDGFKAANSTAGPAPFASINFAGRLSYNLEKGAFLVQWLRRASRTANTALSPNSRI